MDEIEAEIFQAEEKYKIQRETSLLQIKNSYLFSSICLSVFFFFRFRFSFLLFHAIAIKLVINSLNNFLLEPLKHN